MRRRRAPILTIPAVPRYNVGSERCCGRPWKAKGSRCTKLNGGTSITKIGGSIGLAISRLSRLSEKIYPPITRIRIRAAERHRAKQYVQEDCPLLLFAAFHLCNLCNLWTNLPRTP